jgi:hypothetical protein
MPIFGGKPKTELVTVRKVYRERVIQLADNIYLITRL